MTQTRRPPGRYDEPLALPRPVLIALGAVLLVALTAGAWWAYDRSRGEVQFAVTGYQVVSDSEVTVSFEVRKTRGRVASCQVEALDRDGARVGAADVRVEGAQALQRLSTTRRAATAIVTGCRLEPSPRPQSP